LERDAPEPRLVGRDAPRPARGARCSEANTMFESRMPARASCA